jgi:hypothetical protein
VASIGGSLLNTVTLTDHDAWMLPGRAEKINVFSEWNSDNRMKAIENNRAVPTASRLSLSPRLFTVSLAALSLLLLLLSFPTEQQSIETKSIYDAFTDYFCMKTSNISDHHTFKKFLNKQISFCYPDGHTTNQSDKSESSMHLHSNESNNSQGISPVERGTPTHCSGLVTLEGINGTIETGSGTPPSPNDCRWIIISPNVSQIKLTFSQFDVPGIFGRVWIFVGDKDVARWKYDDVIETGRAFTSFNGEFDSRPIDCPSNIVLIVFQTEDSDSARSGFHMSWEGLK